MANTKEYKIVINGVQESIDAVKALNDQLSVLETKINALQNKVVNVTSNVTTNTTSSSNKTSELKEEDALLRQIQSTEEKIAQVRSDEYQELLHQKDILKEVKKEGESRFAEDNLVLKEYSNTMLGVKERLADLKKAMQTKDMDSDEFKKMAQEANELNTKLKEAEQSYGQFGRNVGNYSNSIQDALGNITINVGGIERNFASAREASRELGNELKTMAVNGQQGTKEFKDLQKVVAQLNSSIKDATVSSKGMDAMLDTMQGIVAIASTAKGLGALFGMDNNAIEQSIQKLVALQNVMKGIEQIRQQMNTGEGIGGWIAKGNEAVDKLVESLLGANKAQESLNAATTAGKTASQGLAAAETAQATATAGATTATKALSLALKAIGIGLVITAVSTLITYWEDIYDWLTDTVPVLKNLEKWFDKIRAVVSGVGTAIANYLIQPIATLGKVVMALVQGNFSEIPKIISEGFTKTFNVVGNFQKGFNKETERQQKVHNEKMRQEQMKANEEAEKDAEAKYGKDYKRTQEYLKKQLALVKKGSKEEKELQRQLWKSEREEREKNQKKNAAANKKALAEEKKMMEEAQKSINALQMRLMDEGLNKKLMQLDEEKRQTLNKLNQNSRAYLEVEKLYQELRVKEIKNYVKELEKSIEDSSKRIGEERFQINIDKIKSQISEIDLLMKEQEYAQPTIKTLVSSDEYEKILYGEKKLTQEQKKEIDQRLADAKRYLDTKEEYDELERANIEIEYQKELDIIRSYGKLEEGTLQESFAYRERAQRAYEAKSFENLKALLVDRRTLLIKEANKEKEIAEQAASGTYKTQKEALEKQSTLLKEGMLAITNTYGGDLSKMTDEDKKTYDELQENLLNVLEQLGDAWTNYTTKVETLKQVHSNKLKEIDQNTAESLSRIMEKYFNTQLSNYREFNSKLSDEVGKQPVYNSFGVVNISASKKNYKEALNAAKQTLNQIKADKDKLDDAFKDGLITPEAYNSTMLELTDLEKSTKEKSEQIKGDLKNLGEEWWASINQWIQQIGSTMGSILSSVSEIQSNHFDKMIDEQEKYIEKLQEMYDKQQDITQTYADAVTSIEDELSTARGDRRQQLIDNLNAEMAAQRASLAQEKKIEKEKQKADDKKKKLEHDQAVAKKKMDLAQAAINAAMAISMAAVNHWPVPAVPMMAMAAAVGAAQIAAIKSQNIPSYGEGGVIQGKSHREGGVPVLGGQAEVEGGEFITNKITTSKNVALLEYINTKKKKIDLDDLIEFYGGNSNVRKNIQTVSRKFADGGQIPTLRNDINLSDRMLTAFEDYSNRPVVVSVVDIIDRSQSVNAVRTMAGLEAN